MAQVLDLRKSGGELVILGRSLVLPQSSDSDSPLPLPGSVRFNPLTGKVEVYMPNPDTPADMSSLAWRNIVSTLSGGDYVLRTGDAMTGNLTFGSGARVILPDGTAAAPPLTFSAATNTGILRSASGVGVSVGGTQRLLVSTTGASVTGTLAVSGALTAATATTTGAVTAGSVVTTGNVSAANLSLSGSAAVAAGVTAATLTSTGNTAVGGNLTVTGSTTIGTVTITNLTVTGTTTLAATSATTLALSGNQTIAKASPRLFLNKTTAASSCEVFGQNNGVDRWSVTLAGASTETGGNAGSNFAVSRYADDGTFLDQPLVIARDTGRVLTGLNGFTVQAGGAVVGGDIAATGEVRASTNFRIRADSSNRHIWFENATGAERAVIWHDANSNTLRARIHTGGGRETILVNFDSTFRSSPYQANTSNNDANGTIWVQNANNGVLGDSNVAALSFHCHNQYGVKLHLRTDGYIGIGGWSALPWRWYLNCVGGDMTAAGNVAAYSDPRLKDDVTKIDNALGIVEAMNGVRFTWNERSQLIGKPGKRDIGVLADQVEAVLPEIVSESIADPTTNETYKTVAYDKLVPVLLEAIKELSERVRRLESER